VIAVVMEGRAVQETRRLAHLLVARPGIVALLVGKEAAKVGIAFARSADRSEDMNAVLQSVCRETGCRGGGNAAFATGGGGAEVDAEKVLEAAKRAVR
jgi:alanyl-tRNA synthetase